MSKNEKDLTQMQLEDYADVFDMRHLPEEIRQRFHSDMRIVVDCLAEGENYQPPAHYKIQHAEALVQMLRALTGDRRYEQLLTQLQKEEGEIDMCPFLDKMINQGISKGIELGETRGKIAGKAELILEFLGELGEVIDDLRLRVMQEDSLERLTVWVKLAARAESIEDFCAKAGIR